MHTLGIVPDTKGREAHFQDFAYVLVLRGVGPSEELLVQKEKKYSLGTFSSVRLLYNIPYQKSSKFKHFIDLVINVRLEAS